MSDAAALREKCGAAGWSLDHINDAELLARLDAMPQEATVDPDLSCRWLSNAYLPHTTPAWLS